MNIKSTTGKILSDSPTSNVVPSDANAYSDIDGRLPIHPLFGDASRLLDLDAVKQSVRNLILTNRQERPFQPDIGGDITKYLFENNSEFTKIDIKDRIHEVIEDYEPRVELLNVSVVDRSDNNEFHISIFFKLKNDPNKTIQDMDLYLKRIR